MQSGPTKITIVAGARPNFMKIAPIIREFKKHEDIFDWSLVHTGQHYDNDMSDVFFEELGIPQPNFHMGAGGGSHAEQTARIMMSFEQYCVEHQPKLVLVVGDVNSTLACSVVAKKLNIKVAHVEAGLRSGDMTMPEEINRIVTDSISDYFFVTERSGVENLRREGHAESKIHFVGHVMIDNLYFQLSQLERMAQLNFDSSFLKDKLGAYGIVTLHRPATVDSRDVLAGVMSALDNIAARLPLIFPVHPRTRGSLERFGISSNPNVHLMPPLPYMEFLNLWKDSKLVLTDSGGLQEETTALGIPCITLRDNTERPITVEEGSNRVVGTDPAMILRAANAALNSSEARETARPALWDGRAAERITAILDEALRGT